jgi:hypothetical protein
VLGSDLAQRLGADFAGSRSGGQLLDPALLVGDLLDGVAALPSSPVSSYIWRASLTWHDLRLGFYLPVRPRARAAASPSLVLSDMRGCSIQRSNQPVAGPFR